MGDDEVGCCVVEAAEGLDVGDGKLILRDVSDAKVGLNVVDVVAVVGLDVGNFEVGVEEWDANMGLAVGSFGGTLVAGWKKKKRRETEA